MQPETRRRYTIYLCIILAGMFISGHLLTGPLKDAGEDLASPKNQLATLYLVILFGVTIYGAHLAARFLSDRSWRRKDYYVREVRWSIPDSLVVIFLFVGLSVVAGSFFWDSSGASGAAREISVGYVLAGTFSHLIVLLFGIGVLRQRGSGFAEGMGLAMRPYGRLLVIGVIAFLAFQPLRIIHTTAMVALFHNLRLRIEVHPVVEELLKSDGIALKLSLVFSVALFAPFFEEIFFRGFLYQALRRRMNAWIAILGSAAVFAIIHPGFFQAGLVFPLGLLLAYLMEKTGSIVPCMVVHFLVNGTSLMLTFLMGG